MGFALGAAPGYASLVGATADNATYAAGSVLFTAAAFVQLRLTPRWRADGWRSAAWSDWWATVVQLAGAVLFNVSTFAALIPRLTPGEDSAAVWQPDAYGSTAFLISSVLAVHACTLRDHLWDPTARTWDVAWVNLAGSVAFAASAVAGYVSPNSGRPADVVVANLGTFAGALCFLAGALLMTPDPERRRAVASATMARSCPDAPTPSASPTRSSATSGPNG